MRVARVEAEGNSPAGLVGHDVLAPDRPLAGERPLVDAQMPGKLVGAAFFGCGLHTHSLDGGELALDAQQTLDDALGLLVAALAEVVVANDALLVDEVDAGQK